MRFKTFMEGFITAVGIPLDRASECVFKLDGDKLNPEGTPQVRNRRSCPAPFQFV